MTDTMAEPDYSRLQSCHETAEPKTPALAPLKKLTKPAVLSVALVCVGLAIFSLVALAPSTAPRSEMSMNLSLLRSSKNGAIDKLHTIAAEARAELCPLMGFAEEVCPGAESKVYTASAGTPVLPAQVGVGLDSQSRKLKLPVLQFDVSGDDTKWTDRQGRVFRVPSGVSMTPVDETPRTHTFVFDSVWEFETLLNKESSAKPGDFVDGGAYSHTRTVLKEYKASFDSGVNAIVVLQEQYPLYRLNVDSGHKVRLSKFFERSLDALPKEYDAEIYKTFIDIYGIKKTSSVLAGGFIEAQASVRRCILRQKGDDSRKYVTDQASLDFQQKFHHSGDGAEARYTDRRVGGPHITVAGGTVDKTEPTDRISTFPLAPVILQYQYDDYTSLIEDPSIRANVERAIREYISQCELKRKEDESDIKVAIEHRRIDPIPTTISPLYSTETEYTDRSGWNSGMRYFVGDFNGDGRDDMMMRGSNGALAVWLSDGKKLVHAGTTPTGMNDKAGWNDSRRYWTGDFNGDGATDLLARGSNGSFTPYISDKNGKMVSLPATTTGYSDGAGWLNGQRFFACDFVGSGRLGIVARGSNGSFTFWASNGKVLEQVSTISTEYLDNKGWNSGFRFKAVDVSGDGRCDLVARGSNGGFTTWLSDGSKWVETASISTGYRDDKGWNMASRFYFADVDGNGSIDFTARGSSGALTTWLSNGKTFVEKSVTASGYTDKAGWNDGQRYFCMDVNADMRMDFLLRASDGTLVTVASTGDAFEWLVKDKKISGYQDRAGWNDGQRYFIMDVDGDCMSDLVTRSSSGTFTFNMNKHKF